MLEVKNLCKEFNGRPILKDISFTLKDGEIMTIVGPSGAGKTTLLRIIAGLETQNSGEILIDNKKYDRGKVGVVFQDFNLFPNLSVLQNVTLAPRLVLKESDTEADQNAKDWLEKLQMHGHENQYPFQLSGGQKQRVAIARALAMKPKILCYDAKNAANAPCTFVACSAKEKCPAPSHTTNPASGISASIRLASDSGVAVSKSPQINSVGHFTRCISGSKSSLTTFTSVARIVGVARL